MNEPFEEYRALLFSIAYRMLGSAMEAEDIVQEAYLRYSAARHVESGTEEIRDLRAYLSTIVTRLCLDQLKSARAQRETYIGPWLPEPVLTDKNPAFTAPSANTASRYETISIAFLVLLEQLSPVERAVFLLREVFDYDYAEIARIVEKSEPACRQTFSRAHKHLTAHRPRFDSTPEQHHALIDRFMDAVREGNMDGLMNLLAEDVMAWSDGGGKVTAARRPIHGREWVARFLIGIQRQAPADIVARVEEINARPALVIRQAGKVIVVMTFALEKGLISTIHSILNPDKLAYLNTGTAHHSHTYDSNTKREQVARKSSVEK